MKYIFESFVIVLSIGLLAMYYTNSEPRAEAMTENETRLVLTLFQRVQTLEKANNIKVPDELKLVINGVSE